MSEPPPLPDDWCDWHHRSEPIEEGDFVCGECFHAFKPGELVAEHNKAAAKYDLTPATKDEEVYYCPFCVHDF